MIYKIEKGVPLPSKTGGRVSRYPLSQMKIGDSFLIPFKNSKMRGKNISVPYSKAEELGIKITCRTEDTGVRVWRFK